MAIGLETLSKKKRMAPTLDEGASEDKEIKERWARPWESFQTKSGQSFQNLRAYEAMVKAKERHDLSELPAKENISLSSDHSPLHQRPLVHLSIQRPKSTLWGFIREILF